MTYVSALDDLQNSQTKSYINSKLMNYHKSNKILDKHKPTIMVALQLDNQILISNEEILESSPTTEYLEGIENYWFMQEQEFQQTEEMFNSTHITFNTDQYYEKHYENFHENLHENLYLNPIRPRRNIWSMIETYQIAVEYIENRIAHHEHEIESYYEAEQNWYSRMVGIAYENFESEEVSRPQEGNIAELIEYQNSENNFAMVTELSENVYYEMDLEEYEEYTEEFSIYAVNSAIRSNEENSHKLN